MVWDTSRRMTTCNAIKFFRHFFILKFYVCSISHSNCKEEECLDFLQKTEREDSFWCGDCSGETSTKGSQIGKIWPVKGFYLLYSGPRKYCETQPSNIQRLREAKIRKQTNRRGWLYDPGNVTTNTNTNTNSNTNKNMCILQRFTILNIDNASFPIKPTEGFMP